MSTVKKRGHFIEAVSTLMSLIVPQSVRALHRGIAEVTEGLIFSGFLLATA